MKKQIYLLLLLAYSFVIKGLEVQGEAKIAASRTKTYAEWSKKEKKAFKKKLIIGGLLSFVGTLACCSLLDSSSTSQSHGFAILPLYRSKSLDDLALFTRVQNILQCVPREAAAQLQIDLKRACCTWHSQEAIRAYLYGYGETSSVPTDVELLELLQNTLRVDEMGRVLHLFLCKYEKLYV